MTLRQKRSMADPFAVSIRDNAMMKRLREVRASGLLPYYQVQIPTGDNEVELDGKPMLLLGSSNYLGLAQDPRVKAFVKRIVDENGTSCTSSRLLSGTRQVHHDLEDELAAFLGKPACLVFSTGYLANVGTIPALIGRHDAVFFDAEVHACLIDGILLSGAKRHRFRHNEIEDLQRQLAASDVRRKLVVVDSLYSLNADLAPLDEISEICTRHGAWLFVDDAHGFGVLGPGGSGAVAEYGVTDAVPVIMGVFSKSLASIGGFVAGSTQLKEHLQYNARSYLYSNALSPANAAAALASLRILQEEPERATLALATAAHARARLREMGYTCGGDDTHMVPVLFGDDERTLVVAKELAARGIWVSPAISPGVPKGKALLRTCFPPTLTASQMQRGLDAFEATAKSLAIRAGIERHKGEAAAEAEPLGTA